MQVLRSTYFLFAEQRGRLTIFRSESGYLLGVDSSSPNPRIRRQREIDDEIIQMRVLMITSEWPTPDKPHWVPFIVRQVESLRNAGVEIDVFPFRGAKRPINYLQIGIWLFIGS